MGGVRSLTENSINVFFFESFPKEYFQYFYGGVRPFPKCLGGLRFLYISIFDVIWGVMFSSTNLGAL